MKVKLYVEGGGPGESHAARFGEAWSNFFRRAGLAGRMPQVVRGKGHDQTFELFVTVLQALDRATAGCAKRYAKGRVSFELLGRLNPNLVEQACPHARALLVRLRA